MRSGAKKGILKAYFGSSGNEIRRAYRQNRPPRAYRDHTLDNSLLNMAIGLSIDWGIAYRYLLPAAVGR